MSGKHSGIKKGKGPVVTSPKWNNFVSIYNLVECRACRQPPGFLEPQRWAVVPRSYSERGLRSICGGSPLAFGSEWRLDVVTDWRRGSYSPRSRVWGDAYPFASSGKIRRNLPLTFSGTLGGSLSQALGSFSFYCPGLKVSLNANIQVCAPLNILVWKVDI